MRLHSLFFLAAAGLIVGLQPTSAGAATRSPWTVNWSAPQAGPTGARDACRQVSFLSGAPAAGSMAAALPAVNPPSAGRADAQAAAPAPVAASVAAAEDPREQAPRARPRAFGYHHAYEVRRKIHVYASYATLPLFGAEESGWARNCSAASTTPTAGRAARTEWSPAHWPPCSG